MVSSSRRSIKRTDHWRCFSYSSAGVAHARLSTAHHTIWSRLFTDQIVQMCWQVVSSLLEALLRPTEEEEEEEENSTVLIERNNFSFEERKAIIDDLNLWGFLLNCRSLTSSSFPFVLSVQNDSLSDGRSVIKLINLLREMSFARSVSVSHLADVTTRLKSLGEQRHERRVNGARRNPADGKCVDWQLADLRLLLCFAVDFIINFSRHFSWWILLWGPKRRMQIENNAKTLSLTNLLVPLVDDKCWRIFGNEEKLLFLRFLQPV